MKIVSKSRLSAILLSAVAVGSMLLVSTGANAQSETPPVDLPKGAYAPPIDRKPGDVAAPVQTQQGEAVRERQVEKYRGLEEGSR